MPNAALILPADNNYSSLLRQLQNYGFTKTVDETSTPLFHHPNFHRDMKSKNEFASVTKQTATNTATKKSKPSRKRSVGANTKQSPPRKKARTSTDKFAARQVPKARSKSTGEGKTLTCPKCKKSFYFAFAGTAGATFSKHIKKCGEVDGGGNKDQDKAVATKKSEQKKSPVKQKEGSLVKKKGKSPVSAPPKDAGKSTPVTFKCPKCVQDLTYNCKMTAAASFANHVRRCDPSKSVKKEAVKTEAAQKKSPTKHAKKPEGKSPSKKMVAPDEIKSDATSKVVSSTESQETSRRPPLDRSSLEPKTSKSSPKKSSASRKPHDDDVILSLQNSRYKQVMYATFQQMGARKGSEENNILHEKKKVLLALFKKDMGEGARFLKADRHGNNTWVVDDDDAMTSKLYLVIDSCISL